ncbi:MAG TPA: hypothetical protein VMJ65_14265 [Solirubrobacteraceae bacterium]|nr:hypothetical protein [Solirubrobacteraceae bacterium]
MPDHERRTRTVTLEVDPSSDPIRGIARDELGVERAFRGWVGLAAALEQTFDLRGEHPAAGRRDKDPRQ